MEKKTTNYYESPVCSVLYVECAYDCLQATSNVIDDWQEGEDYSF